MESVTARKIAVKADCSTQPIFRLYHDMEELWQELFEEAITFFEDYYQQAERYDSTPFVNLGMTYIQFAAEEKNIFQMLFLAENRYGKSLYEILNGKSGVVQCEVRKAKEEGSENPEELFEKMWIFIHGCAGMTITGDYNRKLEDTVELLKSMYRGFRTLEG